MLDWVKKQLTEPTAWLCTIIAITAIFTRTDSWVIVLCFIGILLDEEWIKAQINAVAPGISKWLDETF